MPHNCKSRRETFPETGLSSNWHISKLSESWLNAFAADCVDDKFDMFCFILRFYFVFAFPIRSVE